LPCTGASSTYTDPTTGVSSSLTTSVSSVTHVIVSTYVGLDPGYCLDTSLYITLGWGHHNTVPGLYFNSG
jgi:hypothetical protein